VLLNHAVVKPQEHALAGLQQGNSCDAALIPPLVHN